MRSTVAPRVMTSALREKRRMSTGAKAKSSPPETIISPISMGMSIAERDRMRSRSRAP